jgi:hypothetical protein
VSLSSDSTNTTAQLELVLDALDVSVEALVLLLPEQYSVDADRCSLLSLDVDVPITATLFPHDPEHESSCRWPLVDGITVEGEASALLEAGDPSWRDRWGHGDAHLNFDNATSSYSHPMHALQLSLDVAAALGTPFKVRCPVDTPAAATRPLPLYVYLLAALGDQDASPYPYSSYPLAALELPAIVAQAGASLLPTWPDAGLLTAWAHCDADVDAMPGAAHDGDLDFEDSVHAHTLGLGDDEEVSLEGRVSTRNPAVRGALAAASNVVFADHHGKDKHKRKGKGKGKSNSTDPHAPPATPRPRVEPFAGSIGSLAVRLSSVGAKVKLGGPLTLRLSTRAHAAAHAARSCAWDSRARLRSWPCRPR